MSVQCTGYFWTAPKHGSWLNLAENLFGKMARTFLKHIRVQSWEELKERILRGFQPTTKQYSLFRNGYRYVCVEARPVIPNKKKGSHYRGFHKNRVFSFSYHHTSRGYNAGAVLEIREYPRTRCPFDHPLSGSLAAVDCRSLARCLGTFSDGAARAADWKASAPTWV
jgi:hypothetical protein